ncbi:helix-turn-helix domain-containing protein [Nocardia brevicatena]|uniref:helix-turn-helix domain-containing protein n=1 Tax=Nocardia brevicatena TaxID=37327 RepID=UPI00030CDF5F|nr:XRE family transcriptional regulator [Nocardia brevicatena]
MARSWKDVKADVHAQGFVEPARVAEAKREIEGAQRAYRLAQVRKAQARTQSEIAKVMGVTQARVSNIERGDMSHIELGTLDAYVRAVGGRLRVVAEFGNGDTLTLQ